MALGAVSLLTLAAAGTVVAAEPPLTLAEAQRLATARSKQMEATDLAVSASKDLAVAAAERPDPIAKVGLENLPIDGAERFSVQRDFMTMRSVGIMQEITRPAKLTAAATSSRPTSISSASACSGCSERLQPSTSRAVYSSFSCPMTSGVQQCEK